MYALYLGRRRLSGLFMYFLVVSYARLPDNHKNERKHSKCTKVKLIELSNMVWFSDSLIIWMNLNQGNGTAGATRCIHN